MAKVLIRVPCFNHERYVVDCLESIAAQDYKELEVIVIDDASRDGTAAAASDACRRLGFRFVQNEENIGLAATLNKMVSMSGRFDAIFTIASDDIMLPGAVRSMVAALEGKTNAAGVYGDAIYLNVEGKEMGVMRNDKASGEIFTPVLFGDIAIPRPWIMWTALAYSQFLGYDEAMPLEDSYAFAKMGNLGPIYYCGVSTVGYRKHSGSTSADAWKMYQASSRMLELFRAETFYPRLRRYYSSEHFFLLSRSYKLEAMRYLPAAMSRPFRKQFWAALLNLAGLGFVVDKFVRR